MRIEQTKVFTLIRPRGRPATGKPDVVIRCGTPGCTSTDSLTAEGRMPSEALANWFRKRGWDVDPNGMRAQCETCKRMKKSTNGVTAPPSAAAVKGQVAMFRLLEDHFNPDTGRYAEGWSDETIARTTGLAVDVVIGFREAGYGPLAVHPTVARIEADMVGLETRFKEELGQIRELAGTLEKEFGQKLGELKVRLMEATKGRARPNGRAA